MYEVRKMIFFANYNEELVLTASQLAFNFPLGNSKK